MLLFNVTALRDYHTFLKTLLCDNKMDLVLLCPIITSLNNRRLGNEMIVLNASLKTFCIGSAVFLSLSSKCHF